ncbi:MAG: hypothetical protein RI909_2271 [Bacteroidota bacterium]
MIKEIKTMKYLMLVVTMMCSAMATVAQDKEKWGEGEIEKVEIEIVKERQIVLPKANRNFEKVPPRPAEPIKPEITYDFKNLSFASGDYNPSIRPLRLQNEPISKLYSNYVSAGFGNYASPLFEAYLTNKRSKDKSYGLRFLHQSYGTGPVDKENSSSGHTELTLFGKSFGRHATSGGFLKFENFRNRFYGYLDNPLVEESPEKQGYAVISLGGSVENPKNADFNYKLGAGFSYLDDRFNASESEVSLAFQSDYNITEKSKLILNSEYFLITRKDVLIEAKPRHIFKVQPSYQFSPIENLKLTAGLNVALENDTIGKNKAFHAYPHIKAEYQLSKSVEVYSTLTGDIDKVSLHTMARENPWLDANVGIFNTNRTMEFSGGLRGKLGSKVAFGTGVSLANLKDLYFYKNSGTDRARFLTVYDNGNTQRTNLFGELSYLQTDKIRVSLRGDLFGYSTDKIEAAWHRPTYRMILNSSFNIVDKFMINADIMTQGGAKVLNVESNTVMTLDAAFDLNLKLNYFVSPKFSVFVKGSNLLGNQYQLYLNYPVRGMQVLGGLTYVF